jgi:hypothetical protein
MAEAHKKSRPVKVGLFVLAIEWNALVKERWLR